MRNAETIFAVLRERGTRGLPLEDLYRQLFNRELYLRAYDRISRRHGAMTPGSTPETVDGMSLAKIDAIIEAVRFERYRWTPVRRTYIEKKRSTKKRPLGIPTWSDKLLQEVLRSLLEAYYEPQFSSHSYGFRPTLGCHDALRKIDKTWLGTVWFIEGDISACFDSFSHEVLLSILREKVHDGRFIRLIANLLKAGYLEDWRFNATPSGTPQGGVLSPLLANIYLDQLDQFIETDFLPAFNRGVKRQPNPEYEQLMKRARYLETTGRASQAVALRRKGQTLPSLVPNDPDHRRLRYVRYADDWLLGFTGPRNKAEEIKDRVGLFLRETLRLELSEAKTLITHARTESARFLGYEVVVLHNDRKRFVTGRPGGKRSINGQIGLKVPVDVINAKCKLYMARSKPVHRPERLHESEFSIVEQYQAEFRGLAQYYQLAFNLHRLDKLRWVMEQSLTKSLAAKGRTTVQKIWDRHRTTVRTAEGTRKVLQVVVERSEGKSPLVARWGGISLRYQRNASKVILNDAPARIVYGRNSDLLERLLADKCELCGSRENVEVHHIRKINDLRRIGPGEKPRWAKLMAARRHKTLVLCRHCHDDVHNGTPRGTHAKRSLESRMRPKGSCTVWRGADGKVPATTEVTQLQP
jgi:group II intron reverse transcriptase/maturase